jgi:hypothetical protein
MSLNPCILLAIYFHLATCRSIDGSDSTGTPIDRTSFSFPSTLISLNSYRSYQSSIPQDLARNLNVSPKLHVRLQDPSYYTKKLVLTIQDVCNVSDRFECLRISSSEPNYVTDQISSPIRLEFSNSRLDAFIEHFAYFRGPITLDISYLTEGGFIREDYPGNTNYEGTPDNSNPISSLYIYFGASEYSMSQLGYFLGPKSGSVKFCIRHDDMITVWISDIQVFNHDYMYFSYVYFDYTFIEGSLYYSKINIANIAGNFGNYFEWDASGSVEKIPESNKLYPTRIPNMPFVLSRQVCDTYCDDVGGVFKCNIAGVQLCNACDENNNLSICIECKGSSYLDQGVCKCPEGYYVSVSNQEDCVMCSGLCYECEEDSYGTMKCLSCKENSSLSSGQCTCNQGFYLSSPRACYECIENCEICSNNGTCDQCKSGYYKSASNPNICLACTGLCNNCQQENGSLICVSCKANSFLDLNQCICNDGYYLSDPNSCSECYRNCYACSNNICQKCLLGFYKPINNPNTCSICTGLCYECEEVNSQVICLSCKANSSLVVNQCICNDGYYLSSPGVCSPCINSCKKCNDNTTCTQCNSGYTYLISPFPTCAINCQPNYYRSSNNSCIKCANSCEVCENENICTSCISPYYLHTVDGNKNCVYSCPWFFYGDISYPRSCKACPSNCKSCSSSTICTTCGDGYYKNASGICVKCPLECELCGVVSGVLRCTYCARNYYINSNRCSKICPSGSYPIESNRSCASCPSGMYKKLTVCTKCPELCKECSSDKICTYCIDNASLNSMNLCSCNENYEQKSGICQRKQVIYSIEYSDLTRIIQIELSDVLTTPITKDDIIIKIDSTILGPDQFSLIMHSDSKGYTILLADYIVGAMRLSVIIIADGYKDFQGNALEDTEKVLILNEENDDSEDNISESDNEESKDHDSDDEICDDMVTIGSIIYALICGIFIGIGLIFSEGIHILTSINFIHTISYTYLINLEWPTFISKILPSLIYYTKLPNILHILPKEEQDLYENAIDFEYESAQFLRNNGAIITILGLLVLLNIIIYQIEVIFKSSKTISQLRKIFNWRLLVKFYIETYQIISLTSLLQLYYYDFNSPNLILNFISACISMVISNQITIGLGPMLLLAILFLNRKSLDKAELQVKWGFLYKDLDYLKSSYFSYYYPILLYRKLLFSINFVILHDFVLAQLIICLILSTSVICI